VITLNEGSDPLSSFKNVVQCPVCGCLEFSGTSRCPECGTFHSGKILEERKAPTPEELEQYSTPVIDPANYSIRPDQSMPNEKFVESEDVVHWEGGNSDFSFEDEDVPLQKIPENKTIPEDEIISEN